MKKLPRLNLALLLAGMLLCACDSSTSPALHARRVYPLSENRVGIHLLLDDGRNHWPPSLWREHLQAARDITGEWGYVVQLIRSDDLDPVKWQHFMDLCAELHLTPVLRLATVYDQGQNTWLAPQTGANGGYERAAQDYTDFITALRWPTEHKLIIVGNEPNHGNEWGRKPDPAAYARYLAAVAEALHSADPHVYVLNAALDPYAPHTGSQRLADGFAYMDARSFMDEMAHAQPDVFGNVDIWNSHSYPLGPFTAPPWEQAYAVDRLNDAASLPTQPPPEGINNRGINGYEWELYQLRGYGIEGLPIFISETGWRHAESSDPQASDGGEGLPDAGIAAQYMDLALRGNHGRYPDLPESGWQPWLDDPRVVGVTPFALNGVPDEWGHSSWLILSADGSIEGRYALAGALQGLLP